MMQPDLNGIDNLFKSKDYTNEVLKRKMKIHIDLINVLLKQTHK